MLFDVPEESAAPVCVRPGCGKPVPVAESGRGRPTLHCSRSCKSKMARAKAKAKAAAEAAGQAVPGQPAPGPEGARAVMLGHLAAMESTARVFFAAVDTDPVAAYDAFYQEYQRLGARVREAAADARDEVRWPGLTGDELELRRAEEDLTRPDVLARVSPYVLASAARAVNASATEAAPRPGETARAANPATAPGPGAPGTTARAEILTGAAVPAPADSAEQRAEAFEALRRAACTIPTLRFGEPDRLDDLDLTVGEGWLLASWDDPQAEDVHQLLYRGRPIGWTAPLPDGPWGQAGHIAAKHRGSKAAVVLTDPASAASTHRSVGQALDVLHRTHIELLCPERAMPGVQRLALKRPTGWSVPSARGLGDPDREALGDGLVHLTWPDHPGVQELQQGGRPVGWIEEYDVRRGTWTALIASSLVADAASGEPLRCPGAEGALALLRRALGEDLTRW
ncbi:hypothetical protein [Streptomyces sp. CB02056]|uniref:hypothetical protein n=1 Tax=Streptomyces sp. CB02056 TaxID=1703924 RepID=UPI00093CE077|nr:hypothetical protein [Streptomyces sp. CB02056]OKH97567.1 hypothetical protein AMK13_38395 [Streptomyces sp. CB02056]